MTLHRDLRPLARLHGETGLLAAVPAILGFHPELSLVALCLSGPRFRVGPVLRMDLDEPEALELVVDTAARKADTVALVIYGHREQDRPKYVALMGALRWRLRKVHREVIAELLVSGNCACHLPRTEGEEPYWFPVPGPEDPGVETMRAVNAFTGRTVLANRAALVASVAGPAAEQTTMARLAVETSAVQLTGLVSRWFEQDSGSVPARMIDYAEVLLESAGREVSRTGEVAAGLACSLAILLEDNSVRDAVLMEALTREDETLLTTLGALVRQVPAPECGQLCAVLAMCAYRHGEGALAQIAVDRSLSADPVNRLATMLLTAMSQGLDPSVLVDLGRDLKTRMAG